MFICDGYRLQRFLEHFPTEEVISVNINFVRHLSHSQTHPPSLPRRHPSRLEDGIEDSLTEYVKKSPAARRFSESQKFRSFLTFISLGADRQGASDIQRFETLTKSSTDLPEKLPYCGRPIEGRVERMKLKLFRSHRQPPPPRLRSDSNGRRMKITAAIATIEARCARPSWRRCESVFHINILVSFWRRHWWLDIR